MNTFHFLKDYITPGENPKYQIYKIYSKPQQNDLEDHKTPKGDKLHDESDFFLSIKEELSLKFPKQNFYKTSNI